MFIVIDAGNTNIHLGLYSKGEIKNPLSIPHEKLADRYKLTACLKAWMESFEYRTITDIVICSVFKPAEDFLSDFFSGRKIFYTSSDLDLGFKLNYCPPSSFGSDRLANIYAFICRCKVPGAVLDIGSALTFDIISPDGNYFGGIIYPGPYLSAKALSDNTDKLPMTDICLPSKKWGNSTDSCILSGIYNSYSYIIEGLINDAKAEFAGCAFHTVLTGGFPFDRRWENIGINEFDPLFTLKGAGDIFVKCAVK